MSRILVDQIRSNSASADALTLDGSGNLTIPGNLTCSGNASLSGTATGFGGGKVLQYVTAISTNETDTGGTTYLDTGLTATITPASGTKIWLSITQPTFSEMHNTSGQTECYIKVLRDSTTLAHGCSGETLTSNGAWSNTSGDFAFSFLDTHGADGSTAVTYKTQFRHRGTAGQSYVHRNDEVATKGSIILVELAT